MKFRFFNIRLAAVCALSMAAPALAAQTGPDLLPTLAAGVVGSGDQLSLQIKAQNGASDRTLKIGDEFQDGWMLSALTNATATLSKDGVQRTVGLNPTGALATPAPSGPPTRVLLAGMTIPPEVQAILDMSDDKVLATLSASLRLQYDTVVFPGLNLAESQRLRLYNQRRALALPLMVAAAQAKAAAAQAAGINAVTRRPTESEFISLLGQDFADLLTKDRAGAYQNLTQQYNTLKSTLPSIVRVAPGAPAPTVPGSPLTFMVFAENDSTGTVYVTVPPVPQATPTENTPSRLYPVLTPAMVAGLTGPGGTPLSADTQALILANNAYVRATPSAIGVPPPGAIVYGPFGPDPAK